MRHVPRAFWLALAAFALGSCENFVDSDVDAGVGATCDEDADCQASSCVDGLCTISCETNDDCPAPTECTAAALCQLPLSAGFVYVGQIAQEQWTLSHELGRQDAVDSLPFVETSYFEDRLLSTDILDAVDQLLDAGAQTIFVNSSTANETMFEKAEAHPDVMFFVTGARQTRPNLSGYYGRMYQAFYLAGIAAGLKTTSDRLGILGSYVTPAVVAQINAFHLGARSVNPDVVTEVRWIGFWHDTEAPNALGQSAEVVETIALLDGGADIIANTMDNGIVVSTVATQGGPGTFAIGTNLESACEATPTRCLGTAYWNWGPLVTSLLREVHRETPPRDTLVMRSIQTNPNQSIVSFKVSTMVSDAESIAAAVDDALNDLAADDGVGRVFDGPIQSTGQCGQEPEFMCVPGNAQLDDDGLASMCWLVDGIVEVSGDPAMDVPALVPEEGDCTPSDDEE